MTQTGEPADVLFYEPGASWWWVAAGPVSGIAMVLIQMSAGSPVWRWVTSPAGPGAGKRVTVAPQSPLPSRSWCCWRCSFWSVVAASCGCCR